MQSILSSFKNLTLAARAPLRQVTKPQFSVLGTYSNTFLNQQQSRTLVFAPRQRKYRRAHKGRVPVRTGGSTKGTTLASGEYGIRTLDGVRLTSKQIETTYWILRRKLKPVKGVKVYTRVFADVPVCVKGNETKMGKGKGLFEYWATRVPVGKVLFEIGGGGLRYDTAREALKLAMFRLPVKTEMITKETPPRIGYLGLVPESYKKPDVQEQVKADS